MHVMKVRAVASKLDVHEKTVWKWVRENGFPKPFLIGGLSVWDEAEIDEWLKQKKELRDGNEGKGQPGSTVVRQTDIGAESTV